MYYIGLILLASIFSTGVGAFMVFMTKGKKTEQAVRDYKSFKAILNWSLWVMISSGLLLILETAKN